LGSISLFMQPRVFTKEWAGRTLTVEFNRFAQQAGGACTVRYGDTVVLGTAVMSQDKRDLDYFPLTVDMEERMYAAGKIKGSRFIKREGRPTDEAVLSGRLIDRSIRPLFDERMRNDIQVIVTILSYDGENDPDMPGLLAASTALMVSEIPWHGPLAGVRLGYKDGEFVINPTVNQLENSTLDLFVAGTGEKVLMIEAGAQEVPEKIVLEAIRTAQKELKPIAAFVQEMAQEMGRKKVSLEFETEPEEQEALTFAEQFVRSKTQEYFFARPHDSKHERALTFGRIKEELKTQFAEKETDEKIVKKALGVVKDAVEDELNTRILKKGERVDGRTVTQTRDIISEIAILPRTHGSAHFSRGETQVLSVVTLGAPGDQQVVDTMEYDEKRRYMHHYNFPPYSVGEAKPMRGPGRREIGHGALAEKALVPVLPLEADFPYTIRVVSEVLGSNGSSSMASTCGSTLALLDAGVPIKKHVAGVAMGLASTPDLKDWKVITDLQDLEDGKGGMDFKITGTRDGITAIQLDTKTLGLIDKIVEQTLKQSHEARLQILDVMVKAIPEPKPMSPYAPRIVTVLIDPEKIRDVIGPGGKIINKIIDETGVSIDIEQDGRVMITSNDAQAMQKAIDWVKMLTKEVMAGEEYEGTVVRLEDFGAFINILPGQDGLVHVSEIAWARTNKPSDALKLGDKVKVKVKEIDNLGRINLTMRELTPKPEGYVPPPPRGDRPDRGGGRGGDRGGRGGGFRRDR